MISQGRSPILERLLSDGNQPGNITATNCDQNPEGRNNQSEFSYQTRGQVVPYFVDLSKDNLTQASDISADSSIGENSVHYFNPSGVLRCTEDFHPVSSLPAEANVACMPNFLSRVQEPSPFTIVPQQVITDVHSPIDANLIIENNSWENPSSTTRQQFYNEASKRLRHFTLPLNHLPFHQDGVYPDFSSASSDVNNQLYHYAYSNETDLSTPHLDYNSTLTDTCDYYNQPQMQVSGEISIESLPNFYQLNFVPQYFFNQYQVLESHANSQMYNEIQHANHFQASNYLYDNDTLNDSNECQLSDICVNPCARKPPWTILNSDTTPTNHEILENCMYSRISETKSLSHQPLITIKEPSRKSSCIHENDNKTSVPNFYEKLTLVDTEEPARLVKEASLSEQVKAQVHEFMKSPKKRRDLRKWPCPVCGRTLARASTLKIHLRQHSGDRPFKCPSCPKAFAQQSLLNSHHRTHSRERPYSCAICYKTFVHLSAFKTHTRTHTGERPHLCPVLNCGMAFSDISTLSKHARVHSGERPYLCDICNRRFTQSGNLYKHRRTVHKVTNRMKIPENPKILSEILGNNENTTSAMI